MEHLEKIFEVSNKLGTKKLSVSYDGSYHFSVDGLHHGSNSEYSGIISDMKNFILAQVEAMVGNPEAETALPSKFSKVEVKSTQGLNTAKQKTRKEWSVGAGGDPRKKVSRGRKPKKKFTKSQIVSFMRKTHNGKFSSEVIPFNQYAQEFLREYKKSYNRHWWRANLGKGLEHYSENSFRTIVKK